MHIHNLNKWRHTHIFNVENKQGEKNTKKVILLTVVVMIVEVFAGLLLGSMSLLADGWHMGTHAIALGITAFAYYYARKHYHNPLYTFGTGKVSMLGGYTSAVVLGVIALIMVAESINRLLNPVSIRYNEAIAVAFLGLAVNVFSAYLLNIKNPPTEHHSREDHCVGHHHHHDHNLRAAYLHVIADALTSILAIIALFSGKEFGWAWMDPAMGILGGIIIAKWAYGLLIDTGKILLDRDAEQEVIEEIQSKIESDGDNKVSDIHVWRVGSHSLSVILSILTHYPKKTDYYKNLLVDFKEIVHITVEVQE